VNRINLYAAALLVSGFSAHTAFAATLPYSRNFNGLTMTELLMTPPGWSSINGTVDWVKSGDFGITCFGAKGGCIDLDGSGPAGVFETAGTFTLLAGHTYELTAEVSGNQRGAAADTLEFGFLKGTKLTGAQQVSFVPVPSTTGLMGNGTPGGFNLVSLLYTPSANIKVRPFFYDLNGDSNIGPILDNVSMTAVPLPAAAWLMLSGLAALGAVARRRITGATA
jgi:hypothetical protein